MCMMMFYVINFFLLMVLRKFFFYRLISHEDEVGFFRAKTAFIAFLLISIDLYLMFEISEIMIDYEQVRVLCSHMLYSHPSSRFVLAILRTLTHLSLRMVIDIPVQVTYFN